MDESLVTDHARHAFYPLLKKNVNVYRKLLTQGDDGRLHLPTMASPEYGAVKDNNYSLAGLAAHFSISIAAIGLTTPRAPEWERSPSLWTIPKTPTA